MSKTILFQTTSEKKFKISVPEPAKIDSFFVFSIYKAGSTLLTQIITDICKFLQIPVVNLPAKIFSDGLAPGELTDDINHLWRDQGYAYVGFRSYFPILKYDLLKTKNILLIRDPRDMLVSFYFSLKHSHPIPKLQGESHPMTRKRKAILHVGIDQVVLEKAQIFLTYFLSYMNHLPNETTRVYRYEDIIFKKKEWIEDMLGFLDLELPLSEIRAIAEKHDLRPDKEDPKKHVRQVTPGNYKNHLSQATIEQLDEIFKPVLRHFHYDSVNSLRMSDDSHEASVPNPYKTFDAKDDKIQQLEKNIDNIMQSWSWRSTRPLRKLASMFEKKDDA